MPRSVSSTYRELECGVRPGMKVGKVPWSAGEGLFTLFLLVQLLIIPPVELLTPLVELLTLLLIRLLILLFVYL